MLKTRIVTALFLLPLVLGSLFLAPPWGWAAFCLVLLGVASWEWGRLAGLPQRALWAFVAVLVAAMLGLAILQTGEREAVRRFAALLAFLLAVCAAFWMLLVPFWLGKTLRPRYPAATAAAGLVVIVPLFAALLVLRAAGAWVLLSLALIVWVADIAAYFAGKRFGRHKLAPKVSPGKTVEGVIGGLLGVMLYYGVWHWLVLHAPEVERVAISAYLAPGLMAFVLFVLLAAWSVVGDLFESWIKRCAGVKDSSRLLPGHGGVLDRIDALMPTLPLAAGFLLLLRS
ncbi:MAG TPA: phosphatidate cytidylyltransferase [Usitatibacteraceae bacterium]|nr:phosphatidate cytidylyltransferase [Usitatibacteraceae bacterium]